MVFLRVFNHELSALHLSVSLALPVVSDLTTTNPTAVSDMMGTYIVASPGTLNVTVTVEVSSDPCPAVQWSINGTAISNVSPNYYVNDPCRNGSSSSPYTFTITIASLTPATSGSYSAVFSHPFGSTPLFVLVAIPGMV